MQVVGESKLSGFFYEFEKEIYERTYATMQQAISDARRDTGIDKPFLNQKEMAARINRSVGYFAKLEKLGLPVCEIDGEKSYHKDSVDRWILEHQKLTIN